MLLSTWSPKRFKHTLQSSFVSSWQTLVTQVSSGREGLQMKVKQSRLYVIRVRKLSNRCLWSAMHCDVGYVWANCPQSHYCYWCQSIFVWVCQDISGEESLTHLGSRPSRRRPEPWQTDVVSVGLLREISPRSDWWGCRVICWYEGRSSLILICKAMIRLI